MSKHKLKDPFTYEFWMAQPITEDDMNRFLEEKILWNMGKIKMTRDEIDRLVAFQHACDDSDKTHLFMTLQKEMIKKLRNQS